MLFIVLATDKPDSGALRAERRPEHIEYLKSFGEKIVAGGATLSDDGETMTGSFLLVDVDDRAAADAFAQGDPFNKAGLFESVDIRRWRKVFFNVPKD